MEKERDKELVDKCWGDKPPLVSKASKMIQPTNELVSICYEPCSLK